MRCRARCAGGDATGGRVSPIVSSTPNWSIRRHPALRRARASPPRCSRATCSPTRPPSRAAWGDRSRHAFPLAALDRTGALHALGHRAPVESPDPWRNLAAAVSRRDRAWPDDRPAFHPEQAIDVARALRAACLDPALVLGVPGHGRLLAGQPGRPRWSSPTTACGTRARAASTWPPRGRWPRSSTARSSTGRRRSTPDSVAAAPSRSRPATDGRPTSSVAADPVSQSWAGCSAPHHR